MPRARETAGRVLGAAFGLFVLASPLQAARPRTPALTTATRPPAPRPAAAKPDASKPDASLFEDARRAEAALRASGRLQAQRPEWEKVVLRYRKVVARYPRSGYSDNALLAVGRLYREMATRFKAPRYREDATEAFRRVVAEYPSSSLGDEALWSVVQMTREGGDRRPLTEAANAYLDACPDGPHASEVRALLRKRVPAAPVPSPPPPGLARVFDLRSWTGDSSTRVVVDLERKVPLTSDRIADPDRLWIDLAGARLHPNLKARSFPIADGLLEQIRIAQNRDDVVRIVLDFKERQGAQRLLPREPHPPDHRRQGSDATGPGGGGQGAATRRRSAGGPPPIVRGCGPERERILIRTPSPGRSVRGSAPCAADERHAPPRGAHRRPPAPTSAHAHRPRTRRAHRLGPHRPRRDRGPPPAGDPSRASRREPRRLLQPGPPARAGRAPHRHRRRPRWPRPRDHRPRRPPGEGPRPRRGHSGWSGWSAPSSARKW